jgi:hypothetical protein
MASKYTDRTADTRGGHEKTKKTKWTVLGVSAETRMAVRKAAQKEQMTIGEWVDKVLGTAAVEALKGGTPLLALPPDLLTTIDDIARKLDRIDREIERNPGVSDAPALDLRSRLDALRGHMNDTFEQMQRARKSAVSSVKEGADTALTRSKEMAGKAFDRIVGTGDAALQSIRQLKPTESDEKPETHASTRGG